MDRPPRDWVALGCRVLGQEGHGDLVWGHLSMRVEAQTRIWMKRSTIGFEEVTPDDVLLVDRQGAVLDGTGRRHAEFPIHTEIVAARPDVGAVVHTHAASVVAFGALGVPLRPISHEATMFVPPELPRFEQTGDLILTPTLGEAVADALGDRPAVLLINHGMVTVGPDVPTAVVRALILERACRMQLTAMSAGPIQHWSDDREARSKRQNCYPPPLIEHAWDYLTRNLDD